MMRTRLGRLGWLLALVWLVLPSVAYGQVGLPVPPPDPLFPIPTAGTEEGTWYVAAQFAFMQQTNPLKQQLIAFRGFVDTDGSINNLPGSFVGSREPALGTNQVSGPGTFQPGLWLHAGYRFQNGVSIDVSWLHLFDARYSASASLVPVDFQVAGQEQDSFISAPVYNFPSQYAGAPQKVTNGDAFATYGIWNAASEMDIQFLQRFDQADVTGRIPIYQTDCWRSYGLVGGRAVILWEEFSWRTIDVNINGVTEENWTANYTNIVSNRLYGPHAGWGNEWLCGSSPLGSFSVSLDLDAGLFLDFVKERAGYELGDRSTAAHRNKNVYTLAPELMGNLGFWWYPTQGVQVRLGWDAMVFFNTISSPQPVDFNFGALDPSYQSTLRLFTGVNFGVGLAF